MALLDMHSAEALYQALPADRRIRTLSPAYVLADAGRSSELEPVHFGFSEGQSFWLHSFQKSPTPGVDAFDIQSPNGYGGPVTNSDDEGFLARADAAYCDWCRESRIAAEFIRLHPLAGDWQPYRGDRFFDRQTILIKMGDVQPRETYSTRARTAVRKAEKHGLSVTELVSSQDLAAFGDFYRSSMTAIGADDFYMFGDVYFEKMAELQGLRLFAVIRDGAWLSAAMFLFDGTTAEYHLSGTTLEGRNLGATNLVIDHVASVARQEGLTRLYLGGGTNSAQDNKLFFFKNGFSNVLRPFHVGTRIHRPDLYDQLRMTHKSKYRPNRILFYRWAS